jgi:NAD(P)-dependent dehydrogenase (short-subunit alcohol dehydrogenase family)
MTPPRPIPTARNAPSDLAGQVAIVTGGSGGIGSAIAIELDRRGCRCVITGRSEERLFAVVNQLEHGVTFGACDLRDGNRVDELFALALDRFSALDIVVSAAGIGGSRRTRAVPDPVFALESDQWDEVIDTNLRSTFLVCRAAAQVMVKQHSGQILDISSARAAIRGQPFAAAYSASKMATLAMLEALAEEVAPFGVRVTSLLPDAVDTSLISSTRLSRRGAMSPQRLARFVAEVLCMPTDALLKAPRVAPLDAAPGGATVLAGSSSA